MKFATKNNSQHQRCIVTHLRANVMMTRRAVLMGKNSGMMESKKMEDWGEDKDVV
jgi:hypothetical protein